MHLGTLRDATAVYLRNRNLQNHGDDHEVHAGKAWVDVYGLVLYTVLVVSDILELVLPRMSVLRSRLRAYGPHHLVLVNKVTAMRTSWGNFLLALGVCMISCWMGLEITMETVLLRY